jgi:CheY-like chemotaxis protein
VEEPTGPKVLVVDDDAEIREWLRLSLSLRGWTVEEAVTADEAIQRLGVLRPDVVLLDHQMPGMTGIECAATLRAASDDLRIILASAYIDPALTKRARDLHILPIAKADHARLFDLFELLAGQLRTARAPVA